MASVPPELWERAAAIAGRRLSIEIQLNTNREAATLLAEMFALIFDEEELAKDLGPGWEATGRGLVYQAPAAPRYNGEAPYD